MQKLSSITQAKQRSSSSLTLDNNSGKIYQSSDGETLIELCCRKEWFFASPILLKNIFKKEISNSKSQDV